LATDKVKVVLEIDGEVSEGTLEPEIGATVEVQFNESVKGEFGIDYQDPDFLRLSMLGEFSVRTGGKGELGFVGSLEKELRGETAFRGTLTWEIPKKYEVQIHTALGDETKSVGAKVTLRF
jgi:hypothetical protein